MTTKKSETVSTYQEHLPAILQEDPFIGKFLLAFEHILSGRYQIPVPVNTNIWETDNLPGLEQIIENIDIYFDPNKTPEEFLPWLAGWVALSLRDDWTEDVKRAFIQQIVAHYRWRGTKKGLIEILSTYLQASGFPDSVQVFDQFDDYPHYFQVQLTLDTPDPNLYWRQAKIAQAIIDLEKPAQTYYGLRILVPTMMITKIPDTSQAEIPFDTSSITDATGKILLRVVVTINEPKNVTTDILYKIIVRIKDEITDFHLLTPETTIAAKQITVSRTISDPKFILENQQFFVTIKSLNEDNISGEVTVHAIEIKSPSNITTTKLLDDHEFSLGEVSAENILQICRSAGDENYIDAGKISTILGTTTQTLTDSS